MERYRWDIDSVCVLSLNSFKRRSLYFRKHKIVKSQVFILRFVFGKPRLANFVEIS